MPMKLSPKGLRALSSVTELDDEQMEILWLIKDHNDEEKRLAPVGGVAKQTGRGREAFRDIRRLIQDNYIQSMDY